MLDRSASIAKAIRCASVAVVGMVFPRARVEHQLDGYGFLVPGGRFPILGCLFESTVFPGRAPDGHVLLRVMVGGVRNAEAAVRPPDVIVANALEAIRPILGIAGEHHARQHRARDAEDAGDQQSAGEAEFDQAEAVLIVVGDSLVLVCHAWRPRRARARRGQPSC